MPGILTSYRYKGYELNDGINFTIPLADTAFDDLNPAERSVAYRNENYPVETGLVLKEARFSVPINIIASTGQDFINKLGGLKQIFNTDEREAQKFERKPPHSQYYEFIYAAPVEVTVNPTERKVLVTMQAVDKRWQSEALQTSISEFWVNPTDTVQQQVTVNYTGFSDVQPTIEITPLEAWVNQNSPQYYREVYAFLTHRDMLNNEPLLLVRGWDTSSLVAAGKMRADGLDITVTKEPGLTRTLSNTTWAPWDGGSRGYINRIVRGTAASRDIWIKPEDWSHSLWADRPWGDERDMWARIPQTWISVAIPAVGTAGGNVGDTIYLNGWDDYAAGLSGESPAKAYIRVNGEVMEVETDALTYTGVYGVGYRIVRRGVAGTAGAHPAQSPVAWGFKLYINYGYGAAYNYAQPNNLAGWPMLDYDQSDNIKWDHINLHSGWQPHNGGQTGRWKPMAGVPLEKLHYGEHLSAGPVDEKSGKPSQMRFYGEYNPAFPGNTSRGRIFYQEQADRGRNIQAVNVHYTVHKAIGLAVGVTRTFHDTDKYYISAPATYEDYRLLWTSGKTQTPGNWTSGKIDLTTATGAWTSWEGCWVQPYGTMQLDAVGGDYVTVTKVETWMDENAWEYPTVGYISPSGTGYGLVGPERGIVEGLYPIRLQIVNDSYPNSGWFTVAYRVITGQVITIDCDQRTVQGATLAAVSYTLPTWLKFKPGLNTIVVKGEPGAGKLRFKLTWRNRY